MTRRKHTRALGLLTAVVALGSVGLALPATSEALSFRACTGTYVDPTGGLGYTRIRALAVGCPTARTVTARYVRNLGPRNYPAVLVVYDSAERRWRCVRYQRGQADGYYLQIVCKALGGRRVRFRGYS